MQTALVVLITRQLSWTTPLLLFKMFWFSTGGQMLKHLLSSENISDNTEILCQSEFYTQEQLQFERQTLVSEAKVLSLNLKQNTLLLYYCLPQCHG